MVVSAIWFLLFRVSLSGFFFTFPNAKDITICGPPEFFEKIRQFWIIGCKKRIVPMR